MAQLIAPLLLEALVNKLPPEYKEDLILLFNATYTYAYNQGKLDQIMDCDCSPDEDGE